MKTRERLLEDYWAAQAQFGPFDVGPEEFVASVLRAQQGPAHSPDGEGASNDSEGK
jgi:hypothetical protein